MNMANVPTFIIPASELDGCEVEPMTTDILVELFDFGHNTENDLDDLTKNLKVGEELTVRCMVCYDEAGVDDLDWTITLRRVS